jgi:hypothetical protein
MPYSFPSAARVVPTNGTPVIRSCARYPANRHFPYLCRAVCAVLGRATGPPMVRPSAQGMIAMAGWVRPPWVTRLVWVTALRSWTKLPRHYSPNGATDHSRQARRVRNLASSASNACSEEVGSCARAKTFIALRTHAAHSRTASHSKVRWRGRARRQAHQDTPRGCCRQSTVLVGAARFIRDECWRDTEQPVRPMSAG